MMKNFFKSDLSSYEDRASFAKDEPLEKLSRFTFDWADKICGDNQPCQHYHKVWSTIRFIESDAALPAASSLFHNELLRAFQSGSRSVLISGAADTALMAMVADAAAAANIMPNVTLIDRCETPVEQNKIYSRHLGLVGKFLCADARSIEGAPFDIILAHNFLFFFTINGVRELMQSWSKALSKGGKIFIYQTLYNNEEDRQNSNMVRSLVDRVENLKNLAYKKGYSIDEVENLARACSDFWATPILKTQAQLLTNETFFSALANSDLILSACTKVQERRKTTPVQLNSQESSKTENFFMCLSNDN